MTSRHQRVAVSQPLPLRPGFRQACEPLGNGHLSLPPAGCPLRQCWDPTNRPTPLALLPTLSKTAHPHEALSSVCHSLRSADTRGNARHARTTRCLQPATRIDRLTPETTCTARSGGRRPPTPAPPIPSLCLCVSASRWFSSGGWVVLLAPCSLHRAGGGSVSSVGRVLLSAFICAICGFSPGRVGSRLTAHRLGGG